MRLVEALGAVVAVPALEVQNSQKEQLYLTFFKDSVSFRERVLGDTTPGTSKHDKGVDAFFSLLDEKLKDERDPSLDFVFLPIVATK